MHRLALPAPRVQLLLPAPSREAPLYVVLRVGKFHLPTEKAEQAQQMPIIVGEYHSLAEADHVAAACVPGPGWIGWVQYVDIATPDEPAVDGI